MQELMRDPAFLTALATLATMLIRWWIEQGEKEEIRKGVEAVADVTKTSHEEVIKELKENTQLSRDAFTESNGMNLKILELRRDLANALKQLEAAKTAKPSDIHVTLQAAPETPKET
jgi:mevalonate kinase